MKYTKNKLYLILIISFIVLLSFLLIINNSKSNSKSNSNTNKIYIFWTGGYDSTFRICQALIDEGKVVQPIYISDIIDNLPENNVRRKNKTFEYTTMNNIITYLNTFYPETKNRLLPLIDIKNIVVDKNISYHMRILKSQGRVRRAVCQYGAMAQVTKNMKQNIEICVENEPGSMMNKTMNGKLDCLTNGESIVCNLKNNLEGDDIHLNIFKRFIFPTIKYTKKDMLNIAKKNGYDNILKLTWSCWYPVNGKPCGQCIMCHERII
jgi:hypothetical protein